MGRLELSQLLEYGKKEYFDFKMNECLHQIL